MPAARGEYVGLVAEVFLVVEGARQRSDPPLVAVADRDVHGKPAADGLIDSASGHAESTHWAGLVCLAVEIAVAGGKSPQTGTQHLRWLAAGNRQPVDARSWFGLRWLACANRARSRVIKACRIPGECSTPPFSGVVGSGRGCGVNVGSRVIRAGFTGTRGVLVSAVPSAGVGGPASCLGVRGSMILVVMNLTAVAADTTGTEVTGTTAPHRFFLELGRRYADRRSLVGSISSWWTMRLSLPRQLTSGHAYGLRATCRRGCFPGVLSHTSMDAASVDAM